MRLFGTIECITARARAKYNTRITIACPPRRDAEPEEFCHGKFCHIKHDSDGLFDARRRQSSLLSLSPAKFRLTELKYDCFNLCDLAAEALTHRNGVNFFHQIVIDASQNSDR
jgi:hypothetical protein